MYGLDSHGLLCGSNTTYKDTIMDLTGQPYLYYLDALELLDPANLMYARTVCVAECPSTEDLCSLQNLPCTNDTQYVCPYYRTADQDLWTRLPADVPPTETAYWSDLADVQIDKAQCSNDFVSVSCGQPVSQPASQQVHACPQRQKMACWLGAGAAQHSPSCMQTY